MSRLRRASYSMKSSGSEETKRNEIRLCALCFLCASCRQRFGSRSIHIYELQPERSNRTRTTKACSTRHYYFAQRLVRFAEESLAADFIDSRLALNTS